MIKRFLERWNNLMWEEIAIWVLFNVIGGIFMYVGFTVIPWGLPGCPKMVWILTGFGICAVSCYSIWYD